MITSPNQSPIRVDQPIIPNNNLISFKKGFKYRFYPTKDQVELLNHTFGCCRFVWNNLLNKSIKEYESYKNNNTLAKPIVSGVGLANQLPTLKQEHDWLNNVSAVALQQSVINLGKSYSNFFNKLGKKSGYPKFKSKHGKQSIRLVGDAIRIKSDSSTSTASKNGQVFIPKSVTPLSIKWSRDLPSEPTSIIISKTPSGKYYISFICEYIPTKTSGTSITGIDLGIKDFIVTSDGIKIPNPRHLSKHEKNLKRKQQHLSRCKKGSKNRNKARLKVAKIHEKITNQRNDFHHKLSRQLINENQVIGIESLKVSNMIRNRCLSKVISQVAWSSFTGQLFYKSKESQHCNIVKIDTFFPSTHICSDTNMRLDRKLKLSERTFSCPHCNQLHDRDMNAAINIRNEAMRIVNQQSIPNIGTLVLCTRE